MAMSAALQPLLKLLNPTAKVQWRRDAASVWSLCDGDPLRLAEWCLRRLEMGLCEVPSEEKFLRQVMGSCHAVVDVEVRPVFKAMKRSATAEHTAFLEAEKERVKAWDERRKAMAEREEKRRQATSHEAIRQRVAAAPKPAVLTLHRQRLERSLQATPDMTEPITTPPAKTTHSRRARGECGQRLGRKLDRLIAEIQHEAACESSCCASPVAVIEKPPEVSTVVPPAPALGGGTERAPVDTAVGGNGFPNPSPVVDDAAWCVAIEADNTDPIGDIAHLEHLLQSSSVTEGAMLFQTLHRLREALATQVTKASDAQAPVSITAMDAVLLSRVLLKRLG